MPILGREVTRFPEDVLDEEYFWRAADLGHRWWALFTKARQEKALARDLRATGIPFYLPLVRKTNLIRGRKVCSYLPVFPGYVFVFADDNGRVQSLKTNRVCTTLPVHDGRELQSDLRQLDQLIESGVPLTVEERLAPGDHVRIRRGSLAGIEGVVLERRERSRLLVAVHFLQSGVSLEIDDFLLEPV